jgi:hypothetical protein
MEYFDELTSLFESEDADLFKPKPKRHVPTADDHLIESFSKITQFVRSFGRMPDANAEDLNEAVLGTQLNTIRSDKKKSEALETFDELGLLELEKAPETLDDLFSDDAGLFGAESGLFDVTKLPESTRVVEHGSESAQREPIENFEKTYKHLFVDQQSSLSRGTRKLTPFHTIDQLLAGNFYVYDGMMCFVPEFGEVERKAGGYSQQRIVVLYENGTKSNMYKRSLAQRLYEGGSVVVDAEYDGLHDEDEAVGRIYVLESLSEDSRVKMIKDLHKIGVTAGSVTNRIKNAANDPTYLMAPVHVLEDYRLTGDYNPQRVEALIHKIFGHVKVDLEITDKDGMQYTPSEWYSVPLPVIVEAIELIGTKEIVNYVYDAHQEKMVLKKEKA